MNEMTKSEYEKYVQKKSPNSPIGKNIFFAFLIGGIICMIGQGIKDIYSYAGLSNQTAMNAASITLVFLGALLTGLNIYDKIAKVAGAGTIVPITGFANAIVAPALEHKSEGYILGMASKMFIIAGPVLVFGTVSSFVAGLILWIFKIY